MTAQADDKADAGLYCVRKGCTKRWTCNFGQRLCSEHDAARFGNPTETAQQQIPETLRAPAGHWLDEKEADALPF